MDNPRPTPPIMIGERTARLPAVTDANEAEKRKPEIQENADMKSVLDIEIVTSDDQRTVFCSVALEENRLSSGPLSLTLGGGNPTDEPVSPPSFSNESRTAMKNKRQ